LRAGPDLAFDEQLLAAVLNVGRSNHEAIVLCDHAGHGCRRHSVWLHIATKLQRHQ
jgi:hypothetical protein